MPIIPCIENALEYQSIMFANVQQDFSKELPDCVGLIKLIMAVTDKVNNGMPRTTAMCRKQC